MNYVEDWSVYPNFTPEEFKCKHTGVCKMEKDFMDKLQLLRSICGFPFDITSGYRAATHPTEAEKKTPGEHYYGRAADISCHGERVYAIIKNAPHVGFTRIGMRQRGPLKSRFIHLGTSLPEHGFQSPWVWSYR